MTKNQIMGKAIGYTVFGFVLIFLFLFLIYPVANVVSKAFFTSEGLTLRFFGLLWENDLLVESIQNSFLIAVGTCIICLLISVPLTMIQNRFEFRGKMILTGLILVPMIMPPFVGAIGFQKLFSEYGSINLLLEWLFGMEPIQWTSDGRKIWAVIILEALHLYPIMYLNVAAAVSNVDPSLDEAAILAGASPLKRFMQITWPLAAPGVFAGSIIVFVWAFTDLGTPLLVGFHDAMPVQIFNLVTNINENPLGYALVTVVILITVSTFLLSRYFFSKKQYNMMAKGHVSSSTKMASWRSHIWIYGVYVSIISIALIPHLSVILTSFSDQWFMTILPEQFTTRYFQMVFEHSLPMLGLRNSILFSSISTVIDLVLGLFIAYIVTRKLIPMSQWLDALVMIPLALPGIVIAFGYVLTFTGTPLDPFLNPVPLLIIAYSIRRLPFMVRAAAAGVQQTSVSLEEASEIMGASKLTTIRKVVIPLVTANLIAGALLCFAYAMLDVSDSLILAMQDRFFPLTKAIYTLFLEQGSGELVASALGVIGMIVLALCILGASMLLGKKMGELFRS